jgi:internalin A
MRYFLLMIAVVMLVGCASISPEQSTIVEKAIRAKLNKPTGEITKAALERVTELYLPSQITDTDLKEVAKLNRLKLLGLGRTKITDVGLKEVAKLTQLKTLWLSNNKLTDVKGLEELTQLTTLHLHDNKLTDVKGLEKLAQLTYLNLSENPNLTKAQIAEPQKALPKCSTRHTATK